MYVTCPLSSSIFIILTSVSKLINFPKMFHSWGHMYVILSKWSGTCICWFAPIYLSLSVNEFMFMYKHTYCSVESLVPIPFGSKGNLPCLHNNMLLFTPWTASFLVGSLKDDCDDRWGTWWALQYKLNTFSNVSGTTGYKFRIVWIHLERQLLKPTWGMFSILPRSF